MRCLRHILLAVLLLSAAFRVNAQMIREVHHNKNDYFLDVTSILQYTKNKDRLAEGEALLGKFATSWESSYFGQHHREKIYIISDRMLDKRMRAYPHFYELISCLDHFAVRKQKDESLEIWLQELDSLSGQRTSLALADFLGYTRELFENNMLYKTRSRSWYFRNAAFEFDYDTSLFISFQELDLVCSTGKDSTVIEKTRGRYYPAGNNFSGMGGTIGWERAGFHKDTVYAELRSFGINVRGLSFTSDSAVLYNKDHFDFPILGVLDEKVLSSPPRDRATYPRFESYFKNYEVAGLYDNINYEGGIGMQGRKVVFTGEGERPAKFIFKKGGEYFAVIRSLIFELVDEEINSGTASFSIYFDQDSIYHPGLHMRYTHKNGLLSLVRLNRGLAQSPFFDAYHNVDMYSEALYWVMGTEEISFEMVRGISQTSKTKFESDKYYTASEYYKLQGIDRVNPLVLVKRYAERYSTNTVKVNVFADFIAKPAEQAVSMLLLLDSRGLVVYNSDRREALIKQRLYDYLDAHNGKVDYDVIHFTSETTNKSNAVVELASFDMIISGVPEISLSDSQMVYIYPRNEEIVMKKNKDFTFSGRIRAGLFEFYANECLFSYDTFMIKMPRIDSMSFFVKVPGASGQPGYYRVRAVVEDMNGYILIDKPDNKSGLKTYPQYPVFTSEDQSFVYYDGTKQSKGTFAREHFYYELDPFTIDSLDNFSTTGMKFDGYLASGGILPNIEEPLRVMPDYSLGIESIADEKGLELYGGKARFYDTVVMDNSGLHGSGRMQYLNSATVASSIDFFADSMIADASSFILGELLDTVEYPDVHARDARLSWFPDSNLMEVEMRGEPFRMYDSTALFRGMLSLVPGGMKGRGEFTFERALIESEDFVFRHHQMEADISDFSLYTDTSFNTMAFFTNDYRTDLDFDQRKGRFISTGVSSLVDIPFNQFICYMDEIEWEMDMQRMNLKNNIAEQVPDINQMSKAQLMDLNLSGSEFTSTRPDQDSLRFFSTSASYDLRKNIIYAEDVKIIRVADAAIFPGDGKLNIMQDARIETLTYAEIIADTATRYHRIYNANVNIFSRHNYVASGDIDYINLAGEASPIYLSSIAVDTLGKTYASGYLSDSAAFMLSPRYPYQGLVKLSAGERFLHFDGYFGLAHDCFDDYGDLSRLDTLIDPENILIPVPDSLKGSEGEHIHTSLMFSPGTERFYPAFFTRARRSSDIAALRAYGELTYDRDKEHFILEGERAGYLALQDDQCILEGVGDIKLGMDLPHVELDLYGSAAHYIIPDSTRFELVVGFDFFFDQDILRRVSRNISATNLPGADAGSTAFQGFLDKNLPERESEKIIAELMNFGTIKRLPENIAYTLLLNKVNLKWNRETSSLVSYGDIGVFSIGDEIVNRKVPGYVEIERSPSGYGLVNVYFELPDGTWYFFNYRNYIMQTISSDEGYNNEVLNLEEDRRIQRSRNEDVPYEFVISSRRKMVDFRRRMESINQIR